MKKKTSKEEVRRILERIQSKECPPDKEQTALQRRAQFKLIQGGKQ